ncbi:Endonuclease [Candidatus Syntrophocurvum alkaliphilum]|uniref:Endonuclease n=1 Tax=Candidatus Syntrophocurvum alkaliphilum TaxID=2293317 RepID=A0A6I6DCE2_9FIRM|nr:endonuclease Q family protein [Candidatus Syntrophocurvum alkaliphilum]QGT98985.1 Endonuclease [Candidatus Syntrophocurvum alkaliphilum]
MRNVYADLHIHIGRSKGRPVKITASRNLEVKPLIYNDAPRKGLDMIGVVDAGSPLVSQEIQEMINSGELNEHPQGGLRAKNGVLLILGCEIETKEGVHLISYLPFFKNLIEWQKYMQTRVRNLTLSTQKANITFKELINLAFICDGFVCPAHAFTPHKGVYGFYTENLTKELGKDISQIKALELGLSADTNMADLITETRNFTFLSNSDAHSSINVGREYNLLRIRDMNFNELRLCLENIDGRKIIANYGIDPQMGKYNRSYCSSCEKITEDDAPVIVCSSCGSRDIIMGVYDRIVQIKDRDELVHPIGRPPYLYRVPLKDIPGVGAKMYDKLIKFFFNEIEVLEKATIEDIEKIAGDNIAQIISKMRINRLDITPGGGGKYGKVKKNNY